MAVAVIHVKLNLKCDLNKAAKALKNGASGLLANIPEYGVEHQLLNFQARLKEAKESWDEMVRVSTYPISPKLVKQFDNTCIQANDTCANLQRQLVDTSGRTFRNLCNQFDREISNTVDKIVYLVAEVEGLVRTTQLSQDLNILQPVPSRNSAPNDSQYSGVYDACDRRDLDSIGKLFKIAKEDPHIKSSLQEYLVPLSDILFGPAASKRTNGKQRFSRAIVSLVTFVTNVGVKQHKFVAGLLCHHDPIVEDFIRLYVRCEPETIRIVERCVLQFQGEDEAETRGKLLQGLNQVSAMMNSDKESNGAEMLDAEGLVDAMQQAFNLKL